MTKTGYGIGVIGTGTVGGGVVDLLLNRATTLAERSGTAVSLRGVAELDAAKAKAAGTPDDLLVADYRELLQREDIDIIVELVGGTDVAETMVREALEAGKAVVTANKALLAVKGRPLFALAQSKGLPFAFEAAVAGGIPIILSLREGFVANTVTRLLGILNGTCNYILSEMIGKGIPYDECLKKAQELGYAEADPTFDVEGFDTGHKLSLLSALAFDTWVDFDALAISGIEHVDLMDVDFASQLGYTIKLLAVARPDGEKLFLSVHPALLRQDHPLASVHGSLNAVDLYGDAVEESMMVGRGAGRMPTASAVVADIVGVARSLAGNLGPGWTPSDTPALKHADMCDYQTRYYLRFNAQDRPGVFGQIATALGECGVSIASVVQHEEPEGFIDNLVPVVFVTHAAREGDVLEALEKIKSMDFLSGDPVYLRIED